MSMMREVLRFGMVGAIGFAMDGGVLMTLVLGGVDALVARLVSFPAAVFVTWWFNRHWTFSGAPKSRPHRQFSMYFVVQLLGAMSNFVVYVAVLKFVEPTPLNALGALAVGSFFGMFVNFTGSRFLIFKGVDSSR
jgi:putative flippase GtrA